MLNYFVWAGLRKRTKAEEIMTSPPSEQMLTILYGWVYEKRTNAEKIMTSPPSEQMLNYFVWVGLRKKN